jgi:hypothetical protein
VRKFCAQLCCCLHYQTPYEQSQRVALLYQKWSSGENFGERKSTLNLGVGYRQLLEQGQSIAGINLFTDYEISVLPLPKELAYSLAFWLMRLSTLLMAWFFS